MDLLSGDISLLVFRRIQQKNAKTISFDSQTLKMLVEIDGKRNLSQIAQYTGLKMNKIREVVSRLIGLNLVEPVVPATNSINPEFFQYLQAQLSLAIGPLASILIQDAVNDLGHIKTAFPKSHAPELIEILSRDIQDDEERSVFTQNMINRLKGE